MSSLGKNLEKINLTAYNVGYCNEIGKYSPKLKSLTLESLELPGDSNSFIRISKFVGLESLSEYCKELKNLKFTKCWFFDLNYKCEVKEMFPNCDQGFFTGPFSKNLDCGVEFKNCKFGPNWGEHDSNSKSDNDGDVLDNFEGGELELMFTIKDENVSTNTYSISGQITLSDDDF